VLPVELSTITANTPPTDKERPAGHGAPAEVGDDLIPYREKAGLDNFQINFHGNRDLDQMKLFTGSSSIAAATLPSGAAVFYLC
jgi:hypothetical protein